MGKCIIVMGVSGSGKSTVGKGIADVLGAKFIDGDDLHPRSNIDKMASGMPLTDDDRAPWLTRINDAAYSLGCKNEHGVIVCSALKKGYRDTLRLGNNNLIFVFLDGEFELIRQRVEQRGGHFMKGSLLRSQFEALERPDCELDVLTVPIDMPLERVIQTAVRDIRSQLSNATLEVVS